MSVTGKLKIDQESENTEIGINSQLKYKDYVFYRWYNSGKPPLSEEFLHSLPAPEETEYPFLPPISFSTLKKWSQDFHYKAAVLDRNVITQIDELSIASKVEMLKRHAQIGLVMQTTALEYIEQNKDRINMSSAVRLLVEGVRIERESMGIPEMLEKMADKSDDELLDELKQLIAGSPITRIEPND